MKRIYWLLLLVLFLGWGSNYVAIKLAFAYSAPLVLATLRTSLATIGMLPLAYHAYRSPSRKVVAPTNVKTLGVIAIFAILFSVLFSGLWFIAEQTINPDTAAIVIYTSPFFIAFFAALFLSEPITRPKAIGIATGFAGVLLVLTKGNLFGVSDVIGLSLLLLASMSYAASMIVYKRYLADYNYYLLNLLQLAVSSVILFVWAAFVDLPGFFSATLLNSEFIFVLLYLIAVGTIVTNMIWFVLLRERGPSWFAGWSFLTPVFAIIIAFVILGITIAPIQFGGVALVVLGVYLANKESPIIGS